DSLPSPGQAVGVGDVADVQLDPFALELPRPLGVPYQRPHRPLLADQRAGQSAADEARGSGDEDPGADQDTVAACQAGAMQIHLLERSQRVEVPVERAFSFYADAANLEPLTPPWLHFQLLNRQPLTLEAGALLDYRLRLHGIPIS